MMEKFPAKFTTPMPSTVNCISLKRTSNASFSISFTDCSTKRRPICRYQPFQSPLSYNIATHMASIIINPQQFKTDPVMTTDNLEAFFNSGMSRPSNLDTITLQFCVLHSLMKQATDKTESSSSILENYQFINETETCLNGHKFFEVCLQDEEIKIYSLISISMSSISLTLIIFLYLLFKMCSFSMNLKCCCCKNMQSRPTPSTLKTKSRFQPVTD